MLHQVEEVPQNWVQDSGEDNGAAISLSSFKASMNFTPFKFGLRAISDNIFQTRFFSTSHPLPPSPAAYANHTKVGFSKPPLLLFSETERTASIETALAKATVDWFYSPTVSIRLGDGPPIYEDLPFYSYVSGDQGTAHFLKYVNEGVLHLGLDEAAEPQTNSFDQTFTSLFGNAPGRTNPPYRRAPFTVAASAGGCVAIVPDYQGRASWSVGSRTNSGRDLYKVYRQAYGGLQELIIVGKTLEEITLLCTQLFPSRERIPRYMLGYIGGGRKYSTLDNPKAADAILGFIDKCDDRVIPISAFQLGSGYTVAEGEPTTLDIFPWNRNRFPNPKAFIDACHKRGVRVLANVKPYMKASNRDFDSLERRGAFFRDSGTRSRGLARRWGGAEGNSGGTGYIDFTSTSGCYAWLRVCRSLSGIGVDGIWIDNDELDISYDWVAALEVGVRKRQIPPMYKAGQVGFWGCAMQTQIMTRISKQVCRNAAPDQRPLVLTRSVNAGTMVDSPWCCWDGGGLTCWSGAVGSNSLETNTGVLLLQSYGEDVGGHRGTLPEKELFVRWVRMAIYFPRFAINFSTIPRTGNPAVREVLEPWTYPDVTDMISYAIERRYELIPYLYSLALLSVANGRPLQRWTGWGFESDPLVWTKDVLDVSKSQFWLGTGLFIWCVREPDTTKCRIYLPKGDTTAWGFLSITTGHHYASGSWHDITTDWRAKDELFGPALARCGAAIPVGKRCPTTPSPNDDLPGLDKDDMRGVEIFPPPVGVLQETAVFGNSWVEDDGVTIGVDPCVIGFEYTVATDTGVEVDLGVFPQSPEG